MWLIDYLDLALVEQGDGQAEERLLQTHRQIDALHHLGGQKQAGLEMV